MVSVVVFARPTAVRRRRDTRRGRESSGAAPPSRLTDPHDRATLARVSCEPRPRRRRAGCAPLIARRMAIRSEREHRANARRGVATARCVVGGQPQRRSPLPPRAPLPRAGHLLHARRVRDARRRRRAPLARRLLAQREHVPVAGAPPPATAHPAGTALARRYALLVAEAISREAAALCRGRRGAVDDGAVGGAACCRRRRGRCRWRRTRRRCSSAESSTDTTASRATALSRSVSGCGWRSRRGRSSRPSTVRIPERAAPSRAAPLARRRRRAPPPPRPFRSPWGRSPGS